MPQRLRRLLYVIVGAGWVAGTAFGFVRIWSYDGKPGIPARPTHVWPLDTHVQRPVGRPTLVLLLHPKCPCSRATLGELARAMVECQGKLTATVVFAIPDEAPSGWEQTDLWRSAVAIPGVRVLADKGQRESRRFGGATSGQAFLYGPAGELLFAGGITESRGHSGDNAGRSAIVVLVLNPISNVGPSPAKTPVYGCPLFDKAAECGAEGSDTCHK